MINISPPEKTKQLFSLFPTIVGYYGNIVPEEYNNEILAECIRVKESTESGGKNWLGDMYNTEGTFSLLNDPKFSLLNDTIKEAVNDYARTFNSEHNFKVNDSWINVGYEHSFQEYHDHFGNQISCSYYVSMPEGSGEIVFQNPSNYLPLPNIREFNQASFAQCHFLPPPRTLLVFRSHIKHMVKAGKNKEPRVTIAYNFV